MIKKISILTTMVLIFGLVINFGYSQAVMIDIVNAGFEEQWLLNNTSTTNESVFGWDFYHPGQIANYGVWNPRVLFEYPGTPTGAPEGRNVGYIQVNGSEATDAGFKQTLDSLFEGYTTYNLGVDIGNTKLYEDLLYEDFPGYRIELWAGRTRLAFDTNGETPGEGEFVTSSISYTYRDEHAELVGEALKIKLLSLSDNNVPGDYQVDFDNVRLSATPVPEPATMLLLGIGLVGLAGLKRRKK